MKRIATCLVCALLIFATSTPLSSKASAADALQTEKVVEIDAPNAKKNVKRQPLIQLAILLDTSNSMDGLIDQAKAQLWKMVNEFIGVKRDGMRPLLQVSLFEYGNDGLSASEGHIRRVLELTDDLDKVSEELFGLKTNGGSEYCGHVISAAVSRLDWSKHADDLKVIIIAGNEPFTQGKVKYVDACKSAISKGIQVNTIFCGPEATGIQTKWKDGAALADGSFMNIDQNQRLVHVDAPQDKKIAELNAKFNGTFVAYGKHAKAASENQKAQDSNAAGLSNTVLAQRAATKVSGNYRNSAWCLVDAVFLDNVDITKVKTEDLPENMRKMSIDERKAYLKTKKAERDELTKQVKALTAERAKYVETERARIASEKGEKTLDDAVTESLRKQAESKNFKFEK